MMRTIEFESEIERCCNEHRAFSLRQRGSLIRQWREVYARPYFDAKGRWRIGEFEWHVFSFGYTNARNGAKAVEEYFAQPPVPFIIVPENNSFNAFWCQGDLWPDYRLRSMDVYIWPEDLSWTMAFTHEEGAGLGPYFCRRDWMLE